MAPAESPSASVTSAICVRLYPLRKNTAVAACTTSCQRIVDIFFIVSHSFTYYTIRGIEHSVNRHPVFSQSEPFGKRRRTSSRKIAESLFGVPVQRSGRNLA